MEKLSQRRRALKAVADIIHVLEVSQILPYRALLRIVIDEAQNGPPDGESDGSIDEALWNKLKRVEKAMYELTGAVNAMKEELK